MFIVYILSFRCSRTRGRNVALGSPTVLVRWSLGSSVGCWLSVCRIGLLLSVVGRVVEFVLLLWGWYVLPAPFEWVEVVSFLVSELAFPHEGVVFEV